MSFPLDPLSIRAVGPEDSRILWEWVNDPDSRASALDRNPIPWETHAAWFEMKLKDPHCRLFMLEDGRGEPVVQVRFERKDEHDMEVDIGVKPGLRGRGLGSAALKIAVRRLFNATDAKRAVAVVRPENSASVRAFQKAGFSQRGRAERKGCDCLIMTLEKETEKET